MYRVPLVFCCLQARKNASCSERSMAEDHDLEALPAEQELRGDPVVDDLELDNSPLRDRGRRGSGGRSRGRLP